MVVMKHKAFWDGSPVCDIPRPQDAREYPWFFWERLKAAYQAASTPMQRYDAMLDEVEAFINAIGMENVVSYRERFLWGHMIVTVWYRAEAGSPSNNKPYKATMAEL